MSALASPSLLAALRSGTAESHARLDASLSTWIFASVDAYAAMLRAMGSVVGPLERALAEYEFFERARRIERIEHDLAQLGYAAPRPAVRLSCLPFGGAPEALGSAYVVEGSALGGLGLAKTFATRGIVDPRATSFLQLRGAATLAHWRAFTARVEAVGATFTNEERARAVDSAVATFDSYADALGKGRIDGTARASNDRA